MNLGKIANPYSMLGIVWTICLGLYALGWTNLFPPISASLWFFLTMVILFFFLFGYLFNKIDFGYQLAGELPLKPETLVILNAVLYATNFIYSGIPLLNGVRNDDFGIPTVIVFTTSLNGFTAVYCFYAYLSKLNRVYLVYSGLSLCLFILAFSRGNTMMTMMTMFFVWLKLRAPHLTLKRFAVLTSGLLLLMYLFGVAGNYRTINDLSAQDPSFDTKYNSEVIMAIGGATPAFRDNVIPGEFFWTYLYITSPLSNLQYNVEKNKPDFTLNGAFYIIIDEVLFDTISKRIDNLLGRKRRDADLLVDQLTVPTLLTGSYNYAGWGGMIMILVVAALIPVIYSVVVKENPIGVLGFATICTVFFFSIFDNMLTLTGLTLQIILPSVINLFSKINFNMPNDGV